MLERSGHKKNGDVRKKTKKKQGDENKNQWGKTVVHIF